MVDRQLQHLVDVLAERLSRSVVLDDPEVNLLVASRHFGDADEQRVRAVLQRDVGGGAIGHILSQGVARWTTPGFVPGREDLGMKSRLVHAIRWQGQLLGFLVVIDADQSMSASEKAEVARIGQEIAALLLGEQLDQDHHTREQEDVILGLISSDPMAREAGLRSLERLGTLRNAAAVTVTALELGHSHGGLEATEATTALRIATTSVARSRSGYAAAATVDVRGVLLQAWDVQPSPERLHAQASELRDAVARVIGQDTTSVAGVSRVRDGMDQAHRAYDEALVALRAARRVASFDGLALADDLGALDIVLRVPDAELTSALVPPALLRLKEGDPHGRLLETLRVFLDHAGSNPATSAALHIHRTSLYYRLELIEKLTGLSLSDGHDRLALHLGLHVLDVVG